jgi:hypothetical protein
MEGDGDSPMTPMAVRMVSAETMVVGGRWRARSRRRGRTATVLARSRWLPNLALHGPREDEMCDGKSRRETEEEETKEPSSSPSSLYLSFSGFLVSDRGAGE